MTRQFVTAYRLSGTKLRVYVTQRLTVVLRLHSECPITRGCKAPSQLPRNEPFSRQVFATLYTIKGCLISCQPSEISRTGVLLSLTARSSSMPAPTVEVDLDDFTLLPLMWPNSISLRTRMHRSGITSVQYFARQFQGPSSFCTSTRRSSSCEN
jgi:hypothetical protein